MRAETKGTMMCRAIRTIEQWCPFGAIRERFADWVIEIVDGMRVVERIIPVSKTAMVDKAVYDKDPRLMMAHVYGHLTLHLDHPGGPYSEAQEDEADDLADVMLDRSFEDDYWGLQIGRVLDVEPVAELRLGQQLPEEPA